MFGFASATSFGCTPGFCTTILYCPELRLYYSVSSDVRYRNCCQLYRRCFLSEPVPHLNVCRSRSQTVRKFCRRTDVWRKIRLKDNGKYASGCVQRDEQTLITPAVRAVHSLFGFYHTDLKSFHIHCARSADLTYVRRFGFPFSESEVI